MKLTTAEFEMLPAWEQLHPPTLNLVVGKRWRDTYWRRNALGHRAWEVVYIPTSNNLDQKLRLVEFIK